MFLTNTVGGTWGGGGSRVTAAAGGRAILFRLNYTVTQGGQRRNSTNERGRKKIQAVKEGLAPTVGYEYGKESDLGQIESAK